MGRVAVPNKKLERKTREHKPQQADKKRKKRMPATRVLEKSMKMGEIKMKAKNLAIAPRRMKKAELIHAIQMAEGCTPCFGSSNGQCPYVDCCFMADCLKIGS